MWSTGLLLEISTIWKKEKVLLKIHVRDFKAVQSDLQGSGSKGNIWGSGVEGEQGSTSLLHLSEASGAQVASTTKDP